MFTNRQTPWLLLRGVPLFKPWFKVWSSGLVHPLYPLPTSLPLSPSSLLPLYLSTSTSPFLSLPLPPSLSLTLPPSLFSSSSPSLSPHLTQTPVQPRPHIFEISPSQDLLASQDPTFNLAGSSQPSGSQDPGHSQAQGCLPRAEGGKSLIPLLIQQQEEQQREAEDNLRQHLQQLPARREEESSQSEGSRGQAACSRALQQAWQQRYFEAVSRERSRLVKRLVGVPGSTDSGQSSDEFSARRADLWERQRETGVPSPAVTIETPCSRFQEGLTTASSDSSSCELLAVPDSSGERKESKRPSQKVPRISTDRRLRIDREQREREEVKCL